jgi:hypothetical protein
MRPALVKRDWSLLAASAALALATSCVDDVKTEADVPAEPGAIQPEGSGRSVSAVEACDQLEAAEKKVRSELDCDPSPSPDCPGRLRLAGSFVCAEVDEGSVEACVSAMNDYRACGEFDSRPCIVTVVSNTCRNPTEAGPPPVPPTEAGLEGGMTEGGEGGSGGVQEGGTVVPDGSAGSTGGAPGSTDAAPE